jgi:hypothetical protein
MRLTKRDNYTLTKPMSELTESELRDTKFSLNFRWMGHVKKGHVDAAVRCKALSDAIRAELALRAQAKHLNEAVKTYEGVDALKRIYG